MRLSKGRQAREETGVKVYHFTAKEMREHDQNVINMQRRALQKELNHRTIEMKKAVNAEWNTREEMFRGSNWSDHFYLILSFLLSISCDVLVTEFGWAPLPKKDMVSERWKLARFANAVTKVIENITSDDEADIRNYVSDCYEKYGIKFAWQDAVEVNDNEMG